MPEPRRGGTSRSGRARSGASRKQGFDRDDALALADAVTGSRQQFADAFRAAQPPGRAPLEFEAVASGIKDNVAAFATAFVRAADLGWLDRLCLEALNRTIVDGSFITTAAGLNAGARRAGLQRIVDANRGIIDPNKLLKFLPIAKRQVCQIEIDSAPKGTGFLIRSDLVMTANHVVRDLLTTDGRTAVAGSGPRLRVRFGYERDVTTNVVTLSEGTTYQVAEPWLVATSPCTNEEYLDQLPADLELLAGFWDYAIIQLSDLPGLGRDGLPLAQLPVRRGHRLQILQHPRASPIGWDMSTVRGFLGNGGYRILHEVNADSGSSGSPCLNDDFEVVGVHQAGMPDGFGEKPKRSTRKSRDAGGPNGIKQNRAIPMRRILSDWQLQAAPQPRATFARLVTADTGRVANHPVFGRARFQAWVAKSVDDRGKGAIADRFLTVAGPRGTGKSFTIDLLRAMLPPAEHSVLECRASDFNAIASAKQFAAKYLVEPLGGDPSTLPGLDAANTSDNAWLNYQFVNDLLAVLDGIRKARMVWLVLDELDEVVLPDQGQVRRLLDLLYRRAETAPWLRILLLGLEAVPVSNLNQLTLQDFVGNSTVADLAGDVTDYMLRRLKNKGLVLPDDYVRGQALNEVQRATTDLGGDINHPDLLRTVADAIVRLEIALNLRRR